MPAPGQISSGSQLFGGGSVPGTPQQGGGQDASSVLDQLVKPIDPNIIKAAMTPVPGSHSINMPASMTQPIAPYQQQPMNQQPVVGKGNARARGIGNAIRGVTNAVGSVVTAEAQKKQTALATTTQRLIEAHQAIDQANEILKSDPNNKDAKDSLDHNTKVSDAILADPKTRKSLEKGFQISFTDPQQNNTPDHKAVQQGMKFAKDASDKQQQQSSFTQQFQKQMPQQMGPNVQAQQQLQMQESQQKLGAQIFKAYMPAMVQQQKFGQAQALMQARQIFQTQMAYAKSVQAFTLQQMKFQQSNDLQTRRFAHDFAIESVKQRDRIASINAAVQAHEGNPVVIQNLLEKENHQYEQEKNERQGRLTQLDSQITSLSGLGTQTPESKARLAELKGIREQYTKDFDSLDTAHAKAIKAIGDIVPKGKSDGAAAGGSGSSVPVVNAAGTKSSDSTGDNDNEFDPSSENPLSYIFSDDTGDN